MRSEPLEIIPLVCSQLFESFPNLALVGYKHRFFIEREEFFVDALYFDTRLRRFLVVLVIPEDGFTPSHAGRAVFCAVAIDEEHRGEYEQPTIAIVACPNKTYGVADAFAKLTTVPLYVAEYGKLPQKDGTISVTMPDYTNEELKSFFSFVRAHKAEATSGNGMHVVPSSSQGIGCKMKRQNPWSSGMYFLLAVMVIMVLIAVISNQVQWYVLPMMIIGSILAVAVIGAFQLRNDEKLGEKNFLQLMFETYRRLQLLRTDRTQDDILSENRKTKPRASESEEN